MTLGIVGISEMQKFRLKYVIHILERKRDNSIAFSDSSIHFMPALRKASFAFSTSTALLLIFSTENFGFILSTSAA
jgi:hypothetical protein